jgi:hypothetical protein
MQQLSVLLCHTDTPVNAQDVAAKLLSIGGFSSPINITNCNLETPALSYLKVICLNVAIFFTKM